MAKGGEHHTDVAALMAQAKTAGYEVFVPVRSAGGWTFGYWEGGAADVSGCLLTALSAKAFVLPQLEKLLDYNAGEGGAVVPPAVKRALFSVRPCDARAITLIDKIYAGGRGFHDTGYEARRKNTILVVSACENLAPTCFCGAVGGGPADPTGADIMLFHSGGRTVYEAVSPRGKAFLTELKVNAGSADEVSAAKTAHGKVAASMKPPWDLNKVRATLYENFGASVWDEVAAGCISCMACTFVCPSCHCFDVMDEGKQGRGTRCRFWDACTVPLFTLHASGHNPRDRKGQRYRQRVLHKFCYFHENWGENLCVGCGRCVVACPVNVDIREAVARAAAAK
ncbi:MAG: 4Fe-4S dicluster domain-containing protein [Candidatus Eisenbacteria bacterium]|nr:4Fe-4S dicluster domain-containing protein [Candidatus Eisenbacteria bacterium]